VSGVDTRRVVTVVADNKAFRDRPDVDLPGKAMGENEFLSVAAAADFAVPLGVNGADPDPTLLILADLGPETIFEWSRVEDTPARVRTELSGEGSVERAEGSAAGETGAG